jgi:hypothetical protein
MDVVMGMQSGPVELVRNLGNRTFREMLNSARRLLLQNLAEPGQLNSSITITTGSRPARFEGGLTDELSKNQGPELWENLGDGQFKNVTDKVGLSQFQGKPLRSATLGDFDNDGDTDLLLTVNGGPPVLLEMRGNQNNWLKIRVRGTNSNKSGIERKSKSSQVPFGRRSRSVGETATCLKSNGIHLRPWSTHDCRCPCVCYGLVVSYNLKLIFLSIRPNW